jgi:hypothetical protein
MVDESIIFLCPACGTKLAVPSQMAGVIGPCPICRVEIKAPYPVAPELPAASNLDFALPMADQTVEARVEPGIAEKIEPQPVVEISAMPKPGISAEPERVIGTELQLEVVAESEPEIAVEAEFGFVAKSQLEIAAEPESKVVTNPESELIAEINVAISARDHLPTVGVLPAPAVPQSSPPPPSSLFPKTPPPYPQGIGSPAIPVVARDPVFIAPKIDLPLVEETRENRVDKSVSRQDVVDEEQPDLPVFTPPSGPRGLSPTKDSGDSPRPGIVSRASIVSPVDGPLENVRQISLDRSPKATFPEPRRPLGVGTPQATDAHHGADLLVTGGPSATVITTGKRHSRRQKPLIKFLAIALFLALLAATILVLWTLQKRQAQENILTLAKAKITTPASLPIESSKSVPASAATEQNAPILVKPNIPPPVIEATEPVPPPRPALSVPAKAAMQVLEKFLAASNLDERMPLIESKTRNDELLASCLARALPKVKTITIEPSDSNPTTQISDYYYHVTFENVPPTPASVMMLVRTRGTDTPKVVVDPFLDSYGNRLAAFANAPSDAVATFQVIVWPLAACYDRKIPSRTDKLTFKLLGRDDTKEIALAYFGKDSTIAKMLEDDSHRLSYGKAQVCTITLEWNMIESPRAPFMEVTEVKSFDWNP